VKLHPDCNDQCPGWSSVRHGDEQATECQSTPVLPDFPQTPYSVLAVLDISEIELDSEHARNSTSYVLLMMPKAVVDPLLRDKKFKHFIYSAARPNDPAYPKENEGWRYVCAADWVLVLLNFEERKFCISWWSWEEFRGRLMGDWTGAECGERLESFDLILCPSMETDVW